MIRKRALLLLITISLILLFCIQISSQQSATTVSVGVKPGDWVKYDVFSIGNSMLRLFLFNEATGITVEVQNVSDSSVTVVETRHFQDGNEKVETFCLNLQEVDDSPTHYDPPLIISPSLSQGDVVDRCDIWKNYGEWVNTELRLNGTAIREYGGVERETYMLSFSELKPYYDYIANLNHTIYWDKETGFLLERTEQITIMDEGVVSAVTLKIADTNLWETKSQPLWSNLALWIIIGSSTTAAIGTTIFIKRKR